MTTIDTISQNYRAIRDRIDGACRRSNRDADDVTLVAVSKIHSVESIAVAYAAGCRDFGESRVQEWRDKRHHLPDDICWHFIGPLQRNKAKYLTSGISLLHSLDREGLVQALEKRIRGSENPASSSLDVLIEVNIGGESQKSGIAPDEALDLVRRCAQGNVLRPVGLMCIPPHGSDAEASRPFYRNLKGIFERVSAALSDLEPKSAAGFSHLSMGMTGDFEVAVEEGATLVRVGTAIFGRRPYPEST